MHLLRKGLFAIAGCAAIVITSWFVLGVALKLVFPSTPTEDVLMKSYWFGAGAATAWCTTWLLYKVDAP